MELWLCRFFSSFLRRLFIAVLLRICLCSIFMISKVIIFSYNIVFSLNLAHGLLLKNIYAQRTTFESVQFQKFWIETNTIWSCRRIGQHFWYIIIWIVLSWIILMWGTSILESFERRNSFDRRQAEFYHTRTTSMLYAFFYKISGNKHIPRKIPNRV